MSAAKPIILLGAIAAAALAACEVPLDSEVSGLTQELIGGDLVPEGEDLWAVSLTRGGNSSFCTGTLISPSIVLTAAHCIDQAGADPNVTVYFGSSTQNEGKRIGVGSKTEHPRWTGDLADGHDIGMLKMNFPHEDLFLPKPMNRSPLDEHIGESYRQIGFGVYETQPTQLSDGRKRRGMTTITDARGDTVLSGDESLTVCFGDSGGPSLIEVDGVEVVAGVHSFTNSSTCRPPNGDTRVDLYIDDYVLPWVQENDPVCGEDGRCAPIGCIDDPDCEPCGADGTCVSDCPLPDPDCATAEVGDICRADTQCVDELCIFLSGDPNYRYCSRPCGGSQDACPGDMACVAAGTSSRCEFNEPPPGVLGDSCQSDIECGTYLCQDASCAVQCDIGRGLLCPSDFSCAAGSDGGFYCQSDEVDEGGCRAAGSSHAPWFLLLSASALWLSRRRLSLKKQFFVART